MKDNKVLITKDVKVHYGEREVIHGASIDYKPREITALIGPSGSGKSSYLRSLNRANDLVSGTRVTGDIIFEDKDIYDPDVSVVQLRAKIGMVYQKPAPFNFSIYENVIFGPKMAGLKDKQKSDEIVERALRQAAIWDEVKDRLKDSAHSLSGGQQQRICIAAVLAANPEIVLMDEPTSALDPIASAKIEETLMDLKKDYTIIIVTHNLQQAARISDKTALFVSGDLVEIGPTKTIFSSPQKKQTNDYLNGKFG